MKWIDVVVLSFTLIAIIAGGASWMSYKAVKDSHGDYDMRKESMHSNTHSSIKPYLVNNSFEHMVKETE